MIKNKFKKTIGKTIIFIILCLWFISLVPGLLLERQEIINRYNQFGRKSQAQKEEEAIRISSPGQIVNEYIIQTKNDRHN